MECDPDRISCGTVIAIVSILCLSYAGIVFKRLTMQSVLYSAIGTLVLLHQEQTDIRLMAMSCNISVRAETCDF